MREAAESLRHSAEYSEQLAITSRATGLSATQLGGLQYAGRIAGVDPTMINRAVEYLNRNRGVVAAGGKGSKDLAGIFASIGATAQMNTATVLGLLEDRLHALLAAGQVSQASYLAGKLLGQRSGVAQLPLLGQGQKELHAQAGRAAYFGLAPSDKNALAGEEFNKSLKDMDAAVGGLQLTIANKLYPVLTPIIEKMSDWIAVNRQWIATDIAGEVRGFVDAVRGIDWSPIVSGLKGLGDSALWATQHFKVVEIGLGAIAGFKLLGIINEFRLLGTQVAGTVARLALLPVAGLVSSFTTLIPTIRSLRDIWLAFDLAMSANPLGAAIVAAVALGAAAYEVYEHWGAITSFFKDLWANVVASFQWAWGEIKGLVDKIGGYLPHIPDWVANLVPGLGAATAAVHALSAASAAHAAAGGVHGAGLAAPAGPGGPLAGRPLHQTPASVFATPIRRSGSGSAAPTAKVQVCSHVIIDHRNAPPGTTTTIQQPPPVTVNLGEAGRGEAKHGRHIGNQQPGVPHLDRNRGDALT